MSVMYPGNPIALKYKKSEDSEQHYTVIPINVPNSYITAVDVTDVSEEEHDMIQKAVTEYNEYVKLHMSKLYNFGTFMSMVNPGQEVEVPIKRFTIDKIVLKD